MSIQKYLFYNTVILNTKSDLDIFKTVLIREIISVDKKDNYFFQLNMIQNLAI